MASPADSDPRPSFGSKEAKSHFVKNEPPPPRPPRGYYPQKPKLGRIYGTIFGQSVNRLALCSTAGAALLGAVLMYYTSDGYYRLLDRWSGGKYDEETWKREDTERDLRFRLMYETMNPDRATPQPDADGNYETVREERLRLLRVGGVYSLGSSSVTHPIMSDS